MTTPDWRTSTAGTRVRVALWLHSEIGVGATFTKADLRGAFPGVEQIDRRMRDLRPEGWIITTYQQDRSLAQDELRLVAEGGSVWESDYRSRQARAVSARERQATLVADGFACVACGVAAGESYPDDAIHVAKLSVARQAGQGGLPDGLSTLCDRCLAAAIDYGSVDLLPAVDALSGPQRDRLRQWIQNGSRPRDPEEVLWGRFKRLPKAQRDAVARHLHR